MQVLLASLHYFEALIPLHTEQNYPEYRKSEAIYDLGPKFFLQIFSELYF